ncbi:MAG: hypothetical protein MZV63_51800 [Marinilabiliales bacterium]|nr:hypothetical protein [Marinilabiliales bacterium]
MVINNSVNKQKNFITLDKGSRHGVTNRYGGSLIHRRCGSGSGCITQLFSGHVTAEHSISGSVPALHAMIISVRWPGTAETTGMHRLSEIPHHVAVTEGDTIVTSGYSAIFPAGLMVGTLTGDQKRGGDFVYSRRSLLSADFKKLTNVYLIGNLTRNERNNLEEEVAR